jgi:hypothetical protein
MTTSMYEVSGYTLDFLMHINFIILFDEISFYAPSICHVLSFSLNNCPLTARHEEEIVSKETCLRSKAILLASISRYGRT